MGRHPKSPNPNRYKTSNSAALALDQHKWEKIVETYSRHNCRMALVAAELDWHIARVYRVYKKGYPTLGFPPIKTLLAKDALAADEIRAQRHELNKALPPTIPAFTEKEVLEKATVINVRESKRIAAMIAQEERRDAARRDAIDARADEALLIQINRKNALSLNAITKKLLEGATLLSDRVHEELKLEATRDRLTVEQKIPLLRQIANIARFNSEATILAAKAERVVLGSPIDLLNEPTEAPESAGLDEAAKWLTMTMKLMKRAEERGMLAGEKKDGV